VENRTGVLVRENSVSLDKFTIANDIHCAHNIDYYNHILVSKAFIGHLGLLESTKTETNRLLSGVCHAPIRLTLHDNLTVSRQERYIFFPDRRFCSIGACVGNARQCSQLRKVSAAGRWMHTGL